MANAVGPTPGTIATSPNTARNTAQTNRNRLVGQIATDMGSQSGDVTTALEAILAAIQAKPSA